MAPTKTESAATFSSPSELLSSFQFERILSEDTRTLVLYLLGSAVPPSTGIRCVAILKVEKTKYDPKRIVSLATIDTWEKLEMVVSNDIYSTTLAWYAPGERDADVQLSSICPATEKHIKKYSVQSSKLIRETPALYRAVVEPYLNALPAEQVNWVYNILEGRSEVENVIYRDEDPASGFVLTPDLKWDQKTMTALYLLALTQTRDIRSLRDLRPAHLPLLKKIRSESEKAAMERYGIEGGVLRMFIHYQPTYYHFHVHIVHVSYDDFPGIAVGQAHLLDDVIDNLELEVTEGHGGPSYYEKRTLTYSLGTEHSLYAGLTRAM